MRSRAETVAAAVLTTSVFIFLIAIAFGWVGQA